MIRAHLKRSRWHYLFAALVIVSATASADDSSEKQVELKKGDRIIFFGDSLTALAGREAPPEHVS
jgi:hypothetical protein